MTLSDEIAIWKDGVSCVVISEPDETDQCIMYPTDSTDEEIKEEYINAEGIGFVSLEETQ